MDATREDVRTVDHALGEVIDGLTTTLSFAHARTIMPSVVIMRAVPLAQSIVVLRAALRGAYTQYFEGESDCVCGLCGKKPQPLEAPSQADMNAALRDLLTKKPEPPHDDRA